MSDKPHDNEMRFALFKNDKGDNDKRPDYRGTIQVAGVEYDLSAWIRTSKKDGSKFMSGQVSPKKSKPEQAAPVERNDGDDVPF